jgi:hypothetical protein
MGRAKDCFERGQGKGDCEATYVSSRVETRDRWHSG